MEISLLYITIDNNDNAEKLVTALLEAKDIACANILPNITSHYWWEEKICTENEVIIIAKTLTTKVAEATHHIKQLHPYECPCVVSFSLEDGNKDYFAWLEATLIS